MTEAAYGDVKLRDISLTKPQVRLLVWLELEGDWLPIAGTQFRTADVLADYGLAEQRMSRGEPQVRITARGRNWELQRRLAKRKK